MRLFQKLRTSSISSASEKNEQMLVHSGIILFKFYFSVSKKEQGKRIKKRETDSLKQYKLSPIDKEAQTITYHISIHILKRNYLN